MTVVDDLAAELNYVAERSTSWQAIVLPDGERHVIPLDDLRPHSETPQCWCRPTDDEGVLVHHALDRREYVETGNSSIQ